MMSKPSWDGCQRERDSEEFYTDNKNKMHCDTEDPSVRSAA
jgi:hypothetical protein